MSIEISNVSKTYVTLGKRHNVFRNLNVNIEKGVNWGIIGRNGAGKTTLMRLIAGGLQPDTGFIRRNMSVSWPLGYAGGLSKGLTGKVNCRFIARLYGKDPEEVTRFAADWAELGHFMDWPLSTYSSGMRSRLSLALSLSVDFDCILIDEGTSAGDARFRQKTEDALIARKAKSSVVIASHNLSEVTNLCDRVIVLGGTHPEISDDVERRVKQYAQELVSGRASEDL